MSELLMNSCWEQTSCAERTVDWSVAVAAGAATASSGWGRVCCCEYPRDGVAVAVKNAPLVPPSWPPNGEYCGDGGDDDVAATAERPSCCCGDGVGR